MRLPSEFLRLPLRFDAGRLAAEVAALDESAWRPHPEGHAGNSALPLIAVGGDPEDDGVRGAMRPTPYLDRCPYLRQVLAALAAPIGRTRLMRIDGNAEATAHVDVNYYWQTRVRIHVPIVTDPAVRFFCGDRSLHMAAGETWIFDTWRLHNVINPNPTRRIHLVADSAGSPGLRKLVDDAWDPFGGDTQRPVREVPFDAAADADLLTESHNFPVVMRPEEQFALFEILGSELVVSDAGRALHDVVREFLDAWRAIWRRHESSPAAWREYAECLERIEPRVARFSGALRLANGVDAAYAVQQILLRPALNTDLARERSRRNAGSARARFDRAIFIVSSPRSGSSLLFETLAQSPDVATIGGESHVLVEGIESLHPAAHGWESNRLTEEDATATVAEDLAARFAAAAADRSGRAPSGRFRFLEKTPKNSLRIPFLRAIFPDAFFIYLYRDERATVSSMIDAWRSGRFVTYPELPGWTGHPWSMLLTPGWRELTGKSLPEIAARQWRTATDVMLRDLESLPRESWCVASYDRLIANPQEEVQRLCEYVGIAWDRELTAPLPQSKTTLTPPDATKWTRNVADLEPVLPLIEPAAAAARELFAHAPLQRQMQPAPAADAQSFASSHTMSFPHLLQELRVSLVVSTYQSGRVVILRADGERLNTHFRYFPSPMGLAFDGERLAIGTLSEVWDYRNVPAAAARLHPGKHDACFLPRNMHVTGDIRVHELAFAGEELWLVNTRFSALCTLDRDHSFVPRWRPPFVTKLAAEDRCHLNGVAIVDGRPRFATALGATDVAEGWREHKADGGVVIDIPTGELVARGLSMPHSPRVYDGRVWVLESAKGTLATLDVSTGRRNTVAELPGFTRGLAFAGPIAFVGLSQVRERVFEGIPLGERLKAEERACGVWAIDIRSGAVVGFVRFEGAVQEIFDVQVLPGIVYPDLLEPGADLVQASLVLSEEAIAQT